MFIRIFEHWPRQLPSGGPRGVEAKGPSGQCETLASQITCIGEIEQLYPKIKCPANDARRHPLVCQWRMLRDGEKEEMDCYIWQCRTNGQKRVWPLDGKKKTTRNQSLSRSVRAEASGRPDLPSNDGTLSNLLPSNGLALHAKMNRPHRPTPITQSGRCDWLATVR